MSIEELGLSINCVAFVAVVSKDTVDGMFRSTTFKLSSLSKIGLILILNLLIAQVFEFSNLITVSKVMIATQAFASILSFGFLLFILVLRRE
ncbi:hypothetical protein [Dyadobacter luticola]|uniref:Uncharacterized protein n=1 Tax=Dyadobacter luticola TaxID=1979387 RepID=A0A5R9L5P4_9BACT|nr:hypothetical protein [Dyadobacter luticola]TLV03886.1 hypothetical protein FEN17_09940 [Dyadobacter luticola]